MLLQGRSLNVRTLFLTGAVLSILAIAGLIVVYAGAFNVAADVPHTQTVDWLLQKARERSIALRSTDIAVPTNLNEESRIISGAGQYAEMCAVCHLAPGMKRTEISRGLYPRAPELRRRRLSTPAEDFWVIKHGIKMTGMPAWGLTHDDEILWDLAAFLQKLPDLTPEQYQGLVQSTPKTHQHGEMEPSFRMGEGHDNRPQQ